MRGRFLRWSRSSAATLLHRVAILPEEVLESLEPRVDVGDRRRERARLGTRLHARHIVLLVACIILLK